MEILISSHSEKPIYEQISSQMKRMIMEQTLMPGDPIPSMRSLAKSLHVSVITVQRAYEDLQRDGFIETTVGKGSFVSAIKPEFFKEEQLKKIEKALESAINYAKISGVSYDELQTLLKLLYNEEA